MAVLFGSSGIVNRMNENPPGVPGPADSGSTTCRTWSLGNPEGEHASNLPLLLRRVADQMEHDGIQAMDFLGLTVTEEMTEDGPWFSVSVFWSPDDPNAA